MSLPKLPELSEQEAIIVLSIAGVILAVLCHLLDRHNLKIETRLSQLEANIKIITAAHNATNKQILELLEHANIADDERNPPSE